VLLDFLENETSPYVLPGLTGRVSIRVVGSGVKLSMRMVHEQS
jgi:hypothetical protein